MKGLTGLALASMPLFVLLCCSTHSTSTVPIQPINNTYPQLALGQNNNTSNPAPSQVLFFAGNDTGSPSPTGSITLPANVTITAVAADASGDIYVLTNSDVREYAANATGVAVPLRLIPANSTTNITGAVGVAVDSTGQIYVGGQNSIVVFSSTANGSVPPSRTISGTATTLDLNNGIAVDAQGNIYALNSQSTGSLSILVFSPQASGNIAPIRSITGANTELGASPRAALALDSSGNIYVAALLAMGTGSAPGIAVFSSVANGNFAPTRTISGSATQMGLLWALGVDSSGDLYVVKYGEPFDNVLPLNPTVLRFQVSANGNVAPAASFTPPTWTGPAGALAIQ